MGNPNFNKKFQSNRREDGNRVNWQIRVPQVRVVKDEEQLGVMSTDQARRLAQDQGLDLVEVAPTARPPVCRIMDYGRFRYEQQLKQKESARRQRESQVQLKELRLRPGIAEHDTDTKIGQAKKFLEEGSRVQFNLQVRGHRELSHKEQGFRVMVRIVDCLKNCCVVEKAPKMEGNRITCLVAPIKTQ